MNLIFKAKKKKCQLSILNKLQDLFQESHNRESNLDSSLETPGEFNKGKTKSTAEPHHRINTQDS